MGTTSKIVMREDATVLFTSMKQYPPSRQRTRIQALYLLKSGEAASITYAPRLLGYSRSRAVLAEAVPREGLQGLLTIRHGGSRPAGIPLWAQTKLKARLNQPRGFASNGGPHLVSLRMRSSDELLGGLLLDPAELESRVKSARPNHAQQGLDTVAVP